MPSLQCTMALFNVRGARASLSAALVSPAVKRGWRMVPTVFPIEWEGCRVLYTQAK